MFPVVDSETLVFPADEDSGKDVTTTNELLVDSSCANEEEGSLHKDS